MVRKAREDELGKLMEIYSVARAFMARNGNPTQWGDTYPTEGQVEEDIALGRLYVVCDENGTPHGTFAFILGEDPTYQVIDGAWPNERPYGTIHRMASDGAIHGVFSEALAFCVSVCPNVRADTHLNNRPMRHLMEKNGFVQCGMINLGLREGDTLRVAYQREG